MKNILSIVFLLALGTFATAQEISTPKFSFKINILNPGIGGEFQITPAQTFSANLNVLPAYSAIFSSEESGGENRQYFGLFPTFDAEYRFYYKRQKRIEKEKTIYNNSGPYLAPHFRYMGPKLVGNYPAGFNSDPRAQLGAVIGFQKTFKSNFQLGLSGGIGGVLRDGNLSSTFIANLNFSYVILPKRQR